MSNLYLDRKNLGIKLDGEALALYENGDRKGTIPLHLLDRVIVRGNVQLESRILSALSARNIGLLVLSARTTEATAMLAGPTHNDSVRRLGQYRICRDDALRMPLAKWLVTVKVRSQLRLLRQALAERPDLRHAMTRSAGSLKTIVNQLQSADNSSLPLDRLRGFEGAAASAYFSAYSELFAPALNFTGRKKRPPPDPVNVCLSLGYTLLHYDAVRAVHIVGLDGMLGFYHDISFGRASLACDLMEPLRAVMDAGVWQLFRERSLRPEHFSYENQRCLLNKSGRQRFYAFYESQAGPARRLLRRYGYAFARRCVEVYESC